MKIFILRLFRKLKLLKFINVMVSINVNNQNINIPVIAGIGLNNLSISERWMLNILELLALPDDELVIDVGVNIGQTLIKIKSLYPGMGYVGFEPNPSCVYYSEQLIKVNNWSDSSIIPVGIAKESGIAILDHYSDDITDSSASMVSNYRDGSMVYKRNIVPVLDVTNVQNIWSDRKISAIKIDVEGAELGVIKSFEHIIKEDRPYLLVEILPVYDKENEIRLASQLEIEKILDVLGYTIYRIHKNVENQFERIEKLAVIGVHDNVFWCDYVFSPIILEF